MDYKRFISYLYSYIEGEKGVNVGYVRCEQRQGFCRFTLNVQDRQGVEDGRYKVYLYKVMESGIPVGHFLDNMTMHRFCGELRKQTNRQNVWNMGCRMDDFDGVIAVYDMNHMYMSQWTDEIVDVRRFVTWQDWTRKNAELIAGNGEQPASEMELSAQGEQSEDNQEQSEPEIEQPAPEIESPEPETELSAQGERFADNQEQKTSAISNLTIRLMENRPKLPDFENHEIYDCVRIEPNDIGLLEMDNWRLGVNSFLTHGFYNYKYLMLGKLRFQDGVVKAVLGVPGVYDNKEQYIAKIFGFEVFVPVKHSNMKTGRFGYWIVELV